MLQNLPSVNFKKSVNFIVCNFILQERIQILLLAIASSTQFSRENFNQMLSAKHVKVFPPQLIRFGTSV